MTNNIKSVLIICFVDVFSIFFVCHNVICLFYRLFCSSQKAMKFWSFFKVINYLVFFVAATTFDVHSVGELAESTRLLPACYIQETYV